MKRTQCDVFQVKNGPYYLVISPCACQSTYVITIDTSTGNPLYTGIPFVDLFTDHAIAAKYVTDLGAKIAYHAEGLIGLATAENCATIAIVDGTQVTGHIGEHHKVRTIRSVKYITIPLYGSQNTKSVFSDFQLLDNHFYCESYDITRLFPSNVNPLKPDEDFVWNNGLRRPFKLLGIEHVCIAMVQGLCISSKFSHSPFRLTHIARRCVLNPGTRYAARGLNEKNTPGNELECELIFEYKGNFWSEVWRRGSIPIRWKTTLTSKLASPVHSVDSDFFEGTADYFHYLQKRYGDDVAIRCVSLLEGKEQHSEHEIREYFPMAISKLYDEGFNNVFFIPFDLNQYLHSSGSGETMKDFVAFIGPLAENDGFNEGTIQTGIHTRQAGLMRFNCADSLDRTNLATFYYAIMMTAQWCKDHNVGLSKTPNSNEPNMVIQQEIIDFLAQSFVISGNVVSYLYTNTPALKIKAIRKFSPSLPTSSSDTSLTLQRRLENVVGDPIRQRIIDLWTNPPELNWYHRLDQSHVFIVPPRYGPESNFPPEMFNFQTQSYEITNNGNHDLCICLPEPMRLYAILFLVHPAIPSQSCTKVSITAGMNIDEQKELCSLNLPLVENPVWCRYKLMTFSKLGLPEPPSDFVRFVTIHYDVLTPKFIVGTLRIEGQSPLGAPTYPVPPKLPDAPKEVIERFRMTLDEFNKTNKDFHECLLLEKTRVGLNVSQNESYDFALKAGMNPWSFDAYSQIMATKPGMCAFCNNLVEDPIQYRQSNVLPGMIVTLDHEGNDKTIDVCRSCNDQYAINISQIALAYEEERRPINIKSPNFILPEERYDQLLKNQAITSGTTSVYLEGNDDQMLLSNEGGNVHIDPNSSQEFCLFLAQSAIILSMFVRASSDNFKVYSLNSGEDKVETVKKAATEGMYEFTFTDQPITQLLKFSIEAGEEGVTIKQTQIVYKTLQMPHQAPAVYKNVVNPALKTSPVTGTFDYQKRTDVFNFGHPLVHTVFNVEVQRERGVPCPLSLVVAFYLKEQFVTSVQFILPDVANGTNLWYPFKKGIEADLIRVFYIDRNQLMKPHIFRFSQESF